MHLNLRGLGAVRMTPLEVWNEWQKIAPKSYADIGYYLDDNGWHRINWAENQNPGAEFAAATDPRPFFLDHQYNIYDPVNVQTAISRSPSAIRSGMTVEDFLRIGMGGVGKTIGRFGTLVPGVQPDFANNYIFDFAGSPVTTMQVLGIPGSITNPVPDYQAPGNVFLDKIAPLIPFAIAGAAAAGFLGTGAAMPGDLAAPVLSYPSEFEAAWAANNPATAGATFTPSPTSFLNPPSSTPGYVSEFESNFVQNNPITGTPELVRLPSLSPPSSATPPAAAPGAATITPAGNVINPSLAKLVPAAGGLLSQLQKVIGNKSGAVAPVPAPAAAPAPGAPLLPLLALAAAFLFKG